MLLNEKLNLTCEATGDPEPTINWVKDGVVKSLNGTLTIAKIGLGDIGLYRCIARSRAGNYITSVWVDVEGRKICNCKSCLEMTCHLHIKEEFVYRFITFFGFY